MKQATGQIFIQGHSSMQGGVRRHLALAMLAACSHFKMTGTLVHYHPSLMVTLMLRISSTRYGCHQLGSCFDTTIRYTKVTNHA